MNGGVAIKTAYWNKDIIMTYLVSRTQRKVVVWKKRSKSKVHFWSGHRIFLPERDILKCHDKSLFEHVEEVDVCVGRSFSSNPGYRDMVPVSTS